jgi:hypothetical protein
MIFKYINILYRPNYRWNEINNTPPKPLSTFINLLIPVAFISTLFVFISVHYIFKGSIDETFRHSAFTFFKWIISIVVTGWAVNGLTGGFKGVKNFNLSFFLTTFSASVFILISSTGKLLPMYNRIFNIVGILGIIIFYNGVKHLLKIPKDRVVGFSFISFLIFAITTSLFDIFLGLIFNVPFHL